MKSLTFGLTFLVALLALGLCAERREAEGARRNTAAAAHTRDSLKARLAEAIMTQAPARADTVRQVVDRVRLLRDSVYEYRRDTVWLERFLYQVDTLRAQCLACAALLDTIQERYGDERRATDSYISLLQVELKAAKRTRWYDRFGVFAGYGAAKVGDQVVAGPLVGVGLRVFP